MRRLFIVAIIIFAGCISPRERICKVTDIIDGDSIKVLCDEEEKKVQLLRLRTPFRGKEGYEEATRAMREMVEEKQVRLEFEKPRKVETNFFGDYLSYVFVGELNVNIEMVRLGHSEFWTNFGTGRFTEEFKKAEAEARADKRGIWANK